MFKDKMYFLKIRKEPQKHAKFEGIENHLTQEKKTKLYNYYICDNCSCEIKIEKNWENKKGGIVFLDSYLTKRDGILVALCNNCLKTVLKEFEGSDNI